MSPRDLAFKIGYVTQRPEQQIVTDKVWHELSFALENMGLPSDEIRRRVAEVACFLALRICLTAARTSFPAGRNSY